MLLGIGSGRAVHDAVLRLGERVRSERLKIRAVAASRESSALLRAQGIPELPCDDVPSLDLGIDGADYLTPSLDLLKGGGGALLREKLVALACRRWVIAAEAEKLRQDLSGLSVPVEVASFAHHSTARRIAALGYLVAVRRAADGTVHLSDNGNPIYDCVPSAGQSAQEGAQALKALPGVLETGYFFALADLAFVLDGGRVLRLEGPRGD